MCKVLPGAYDFDSIVSVQHVRNIHERLSIRTRQVSIYKNKYKTVAVLGCFTSGSTYKKEIV